MATANKNPVFNLSDIQHKLDVEQHKLIHLCEKDVIIPDYEDSAGRGTMRRFSERNLFEFALALELRRFYLPVNYITPIIRILESFETYVAREIDVFSLPKSLQDKSLVRLRLMIAEGEHLWFGMKYGKSEVFLGELNLSSISTKKPSLSGIKKSALDPRDGFVSFIEIDLNKIASRLI